MRLSHSQAADTPASDTLQSLPHPQTSCRMLSLQLCHLLHVLFSAPAVWLLASGRLESPSVPIAHLRLA